MSGWSDDKGGEAGQTDSEISAPVGRHSDEPRKPDVGA